MSCPWIRQWFMTLKAQATNEKIGSSIQNLESILIIHINQFCTTITKYLRQTNLIKKEVYLAHSLKPEVQTAGSTPRQAPLPGCITL